VLLSWRARAGECAGASPNLCYPRLFRNSSPSTRCLYSDDSTLPRSLFAASKSAAAFGLSPFPFFIIAAAHQPTRVALGWRAALRLTDGAAMGGVGHAAAPVVVGCGHGQP